MFDIAYLPETTIEAARFEKEKIWKKILKIDLLKSIDAFFECMELGRYGDIVTYWSFIYYTHGGI